jgi:hypothetical protein
MELIQEKQQQQQLSTRNALLLSSLKKFFETKEHLIKMAKIVNGETRISLRIIDWFVTNYAKKNYVVYDLPNQTRFKVHNDYKLKLKAYSKRLFDSFCRWERILIPFGDDRDMETTIGQLNFFKWSIENGILDYIEQNYEDIEKDMNQRNSLAKRRTVTKMSLSSNATTDTADSIDTEFAETDTNDVIESKGAADAKGAADSKTRKKREELSVSACKCIKKEHVKIIVKFH